MKIVAFLLRSSKRMVLLAIVAGGLSGLGSTALLGVFNAKLTDRAAPGPLLWSFLGLCALVPLARIVSELLLIRLGQDTIFKLRVELSRRLLSVPLRRLEEMGPHRLLSTLTEDVAAVSAVVIIVPTLCVNAAIVGSALIYLAWLSWQVFAIVAGLAILAILGYQIPFVRAFRFLERAREIHDELYDFLRTLIGGAKELKLHRGRREAFLTEDLEATAQSFRRQNVKGMEIYTLASSWGQLLVFVVVGVLLFGFGTRLGFDRSTLTGYTITLLYIMTPFQVLLNAAPTFARAGVTLARIERMGLDLASDTSDAGLASPERERSWAKLELIGVTHAYHREGEESPFCLGPIDLTLTPGELVFIAGGNGSGKTTLAKLLLGLYVPEVGEVRCDGQRVTNANRDAYRQGFSAVFSDFHLFRNLIGLDAESGEESARLYLQELHLAHKVRIENGRLSSTDLSQGQRKRLALLAAYFEDRPVYLFDEWAADQDPVFKEIFYRRLLPALAARNKTVVVISHDEAFYDVADRLIKLESGRIVADERRPAARRASLPERPAARTEPALVTREQWREETYG